MNDCNCNEIFAMFSYSLMLDCWTEEPGDRPRFHDIKMRLDHMLKEDIKDVSRNSLHFYR